MAVSESPAAVSVGWRVLLPMVGLTMGLLVACGGREPLPQGEVLELELGGESPRVTDEQLRMALEREVGPDPEQAQELPFPGEESPNLGDPAEAVASGTAREGVPAEASGRRAEVPPPDEDPGQTSLPAQEEPPEDPPGPPAAQNPAASNQPPAARSVIMAEGETLYRIAVRELGDGNRWREIAQLNGWTEQQVSTLPEGTEVKLPVR